MIYYWKNAFSTDAHLLKVNIISSAIKDIHSGNYVNHDLEKLSKHNIYSYRLSKKSSLTINNTSKYLSYS